MVQTHEICRETKLSATPEQVWEAIATGPGNLGWLFPMEIEPWEGGVVSRGPCTVTCWEPPRRFTCRAEKTDGFTATLDYSIETSDDRNTTLHALVCWVNRGIVDDDWEIKSDAADKHTDLYHHTLGQYLRYFTGRSATYVQVEQPAATGANAFTALRHELGLSDDVAEGDAVRLALPGLNALDAVVDYLRPQFVGLRTADGLYRFFGRNAWKWPIRVGHHLFADDADQEKAEHAWRVWLDRVFT